jgi:hypothetical protein
MTNNDHTRHRLKQAELGRALVKLAKDAQQGEALVFAEAAATTFKRAIAKFAVISDPVECATVTNQY